MKFVTYNYKDNQYVGFTEEDKIYKIPDKEDMFQVIEKYSELDFDSIKKNTNFLTLDEIDLIAPITKPKHDIICVGKNYKEHIEELGFNLEKDFTASYFGKRAVKIMGPNEDIQGRFDLDEALDYEVELAVIIGRECKNVKKENALDYIFGYTIFNDLSSRNMQKKHGQWYRGKGLDEYSIMGPYIVTKDELDPSNLSIKSYVNEELRQNSSTSNMIIKIDEIIEELSSGTTLEIGDIISTGTPEGVGLGYNPPKFLKKGDIVRCEIEGLDSITNKII